MQSLILECNLHLPSHNGTQSFLVIGGNGAGAGDGGYVGGVGGLVGGAGVGALGGGR